MENRSIEVYPVEDLQKVKDLLKFCGNAKNLMVEKAGKKNIIVLDNEKIVKNKELWTDFHKNSKDKNEDSILKLQYIEQYNLILTYLS